MLVVCAQGMSGEEFGGGGGQPCEPPPAEIYSIVSTLG